MAKILILDEDVQTQAALQTILQKQGHEVAAADPHHLGLNGSETFHPQLIIYAWKSGEVDPLSAIKTLKTNPDLAPAFYLLLTQPELLQSQFSSLETLVDDWLFYPLDAEELNRRVSRGLKPGKTANSPQPQDALSARLSAQEELMEREKFATLGELLSGIIHEINNPVSVVKGNVSHVAEYAQDLIDLLELYGEEYPEPPAEIQDRIEEIDLEFLLEDLPQVIESMKNATERIRLLVQSLRNVYRAEDSEEKLADIHQIIDDIALVLHAKLKGKKGRAVNLIKNYGELSEIKCYPGQIGQVLMSLLNSSIDGLEEKRSETSSEEPTIWIETKVVSGESNAANTPQVRIGIKDNGAGIAGEMKNYKMCHQIVVETHRGRLECVAQPGEGTELIVLLPLK